MSATPIHIEVPAELTPTERGIPVDEVPGGKTGHAAYALCSLFNYASMALFDGASEADLYETLMAAQLHVKARNAERGLA
jgi:hypothetical protein